MELNDIRTAKKELEENIENLLEEFLKETGVRVLKIYVNNWQTYDGVERKYGCNPDVKLDDI